VFLFCVSFDSSRAKTQAGRLASLPASQDVSSFFTARCESSPRFRSRSPASFCKARAVLVRVQERSVSCGKSFPAPIFTIVPVSVRCSAPRSARPGGFLPFDLLSGSGHSAKVLLSCSFSRPQKRASHVRCSSPFSVRLGQADFPTGLLFGACAEFSSIPSSSPSRFCLLLTSVLCAPV
jgi:hypothetical protein